jgi:hypothetical protein
MYEFAGCMQVARSIHVTKINGVLLQVQNMDEDDAVIAHRADAVIAWFCGLLVIGVAVHTGNSTLVNAASVLMRLDTVLVVSFLLTQCMHMVVLVATRYRTGVYSDSILGMWLIMSVSAFFVSCLPIAIHRTWQQFAELALPSATSLSILIGFIVLTAANSGCDLRRRDVYSVKVFLSSGSLLLAYCVAVVLVNVFSPVDVFPYAFIPPTGVLRFWLLPLSLHVVHVIVFLICKQLYRLRNVADIRAPTLRPKYQTKEKEMTDADTFSLENEDESTAVI